MASLVWLCVPFIDSARCFCHRIQPAYPILLLQFYRYSFYIISQCFLRHVCILLYIVYYYTNIVKFPISVKVISRGVWEKVSKIGSLNGRMYLNTIFFELFYYYFFKYIIYYNIIFSIYLNCIIFFLTEILLPAVLTTNVILGTAINYDNHFVIITENCVYSEHFSIITDDLLTHTNYYYCRTKSFIESMRNKYNYFRF